MSDERNRTGNARSPDRGSRARFAIEVLKAEIESLQRPAPARPGGSGEYPPPRRARKGGSLAICGDQIRPRHARRSPTISPAPWRPARRIVRDAADPQVKAVLDGVEATDRQLLATLERYGVKPVATEDGKFDPNLHQAIAEVPGNGKPAGSIVDVVQTGYMIGDRLLRPAMVTVARRGERRRRASRHEGLSDGGPQHRRRRALRAAWAAPWCARSRRARA